MRRGGRRSVAIVVLSALVAISVLGLLSQAGAQVPPLPIGPTQPPAPLPAEQQSGGSVTDTGWWNQARPRVSGLPTGDIPAPPAPGIPPGGLAVSALLGEPIHVSAVEIDLDANKGATVEAFVLKLHEHPGGETLAPLGSIILACPITSFWFGGENGVWDTRPVADCEGAAVQGVRADDGSWTWDLRPIGQQWADGSLPQHGVLLVEAVEAPVTFQTVFVGDRGSIGLAITATGGTPPVDPFSAGDGMPAGSGSTASSGAPSLTGGTSRSTGVTSGTTSAAPVATPQPAAPTGAVSDAGAQAPGSTSESPLGSLPGWTWLLVLVTAGGALLAMLALGPGGTPTTRTATGRGVSRALAERRRHRESTDAMASLGTPAMEV